MCRCRFSSINLYVIFSFSISLCITCSSTFRIYGVFHVDRFGLCAAFAAGFVIARALFFYCIHIGSESREEEKKNRSKTEEYHNYDGILLLLGEYFNCIAKMHGRSNNNAMRLKRTNANRLQHSIVFIEVLFHFIKFLPCIFIRVQTSVSSVNKKCKHALRSQAIIAPMYKRSIGQNCRYYRNMVHTLYYTVRRRTKNPFRIFRFSIGELESFGFEKNEFTERRRD